MLVCMKTGWLWKKFRSTQWLHVQWCWFGQTSWPTCILYTNTAVNSLYLYTFRVLCTFLPGHARTAPNPMRLACTSAVKQFSLSAYWWLIIDLVTSQGHTSLHRSNINYAQVCNKPTHAQCILYCQLWLEWVSRTRTKVGKVCTHVVHFFCCWATAGHFRFLVTNTHTHTHTHTSTDLQGKTANIIPSASRKNLGKVLCY